MLWHIEQKFCIWLYFTVLQIKFKCCQFASIFIRPSLNGMVMSVRVAGAPSVRPTLRPSGSPSARFPHFSPTWFDILSWNFAHDFVFMYYRSSESVVTLRQFLKELCLFVNLEYRKCEVFRTFFLHALTYWAEIWHITFFNVLQIKFECRHFVSIFEGVMPLCELGVSTESQKRTSVLKTRQYFFATRSMTRLNVGLALIYVKLLLSSWKTYMCNLKAWFINK